MEDRIDEIKKKKKKKGKHSPPIPHLLQAQQAPALPYAKVVGRPGPGSYPEPFARPNHPRRGLVEINAKDNSEMSLYSAIKNVSIVKI